MNSCEKFLKILRENKDNIIDKTDWPQEQKDQAKKFFKLHPEQEGKLGGKWSNPKGLSFLNDIQPIIDDFNNRESKSKTKKEIKNKVKKTNDLGDYFRGRNGKNNFEFDIMYSDDEFVLGFPLTWETCVYLDSFEDFGVGAKWCIGEKETSKYWYEYTADRNVFLFFFTKKDMDSVLRENDKEKGSNLVYKQHLDLKYMIQYYKGDYNVWDANDEMIKKTSSSLYEVITKVCLELTDNLDDFFSESEHENKYKSQQWVESVKSRLTPQLFKQIEDSIPKYQQVLLGKVLNYFNEILDTLKEEKAKRFVETDINSGNEYVQERWRRTGGMNILQSMWDYIWNKLVSEIPCDILNYNEDASYFIEMILNLLKNKYIGQNSKFTEDDMFKLDLIQDFLDFNEIGEIPTYGSISDFISGTTT